MIVLTKRSLARPHYWFRHICEIEPAAFGLEYLIVDVDNTIVPKCDDAVPEAVITYFARLGSQGVKICLLSNTVAGARRFARIQFIASALNVPFVCANGFKCKPHPEPFRKAMALIGAIPAKTGVIGDQLLTDIQGGNRLGCRTFWVCPLGKDGWYSWYKRLVERFLLKTTLKDLTIQAK